MQFVWALRRISPEEKFQVDLLQLLPQNWMDGFPLKTERSDNELFRV